MPVSTSRYTGGAQLVPGEPFVHAPDERHFGSRTGRHECPVRLDVLVFVPFGLAFDMSFAVNQHATKTIRDLDMGAARRLMISLPPLVDQEIQTHLIKLSRGR